MLLRPQPSPPDVVLLLDDLPVLVVASVRAGRTGTPARCHGLVNRAEVGVGPLLLLHEHTNHNKRQLESVERTLGSNRPVANYTHDLSNLKNNTTIHQGAIIDSFKHCYNNIVFDLA